MSDPTPLTTRLAALRGQLPGLPDYATLAGLAVELRAFRGIGTEPETSLTGLLAGLLGVNPASLDDVRIKTEEVRAQVEALASGVASVSEQVNLLGTTANALNTAVGGVPDDALDLLSVRGLLYAIYQLLRRQYLGLAPSVPDGSIPSGGSKVIEGYRWAVFTPPITGVTVAADGITLTATEGWAGWQGYIQSPAPMGIAGSDDVQTGEWFDLSGSGTYSFGVPVEYPITAYIRNNGLEFVTYTTTFTGGSNTILLPGVDHNEYGQNLADLYHYSFRFHADTLTRESGGPGGVGDPRLAAEPGTVRIVYPTLAMGTWYHFTGHTTMVQWYSFLSAFSLDLAPGIIPGSEAI